MKKVNVLLKQAELFENMSVYGQSVYGPEKDEYDPEKDEYDNYPYPDGYPSARPAGWFTVPPKTPKTVVPAVKTQSELYAENSKSAEYMGNLLQRLTTLPDEKMLPIPANAKNISDMNNAKTKIVPFLTRLILTLDGESADKYQRIIKAFQAKCLNQNFNKLTEFDKIPQKVLDPNTPSGAAKYLSSGPGKLPPPA